jgi:ribonuclease BN (tRNA processing enzyme)
MFLRHSFVFTERATFKLEYREFEHEEEIRVSENIIIKSRQNSHLDKYLKYLDDKSVCSCSSFLFNIDSKRIFYTGDISSKDDLYLFEDDYPEIVITESTHVELDDILEYCKMKKPKRIYLIHFSDELQVQLKKKIGSIPQSVRSKVILTNDAMNIKI